MGAPQALHNFAKSNARYSERGVDFIYATAVKASAEASLRRFALNHLLQDRNATRAKVV